MVLHLSPSSPPCNTAMVSPGAAAAHGRGWFCLLHRVFRSDNEEAGFGSFACSCPPAARDQHALLQLTGLRTSVAAAHDSPMVGLFICHERHADGCHKSCVASQ